jgi:hypothetical protein
MPRKRKPTARELVELAIVHLDDGAPFSAARCLREAADVIETAGKRFNAQLDKAIGVGRLGKPEGKE